MATDTPVLRWSTYFDQGEHWQPDGRPVVAIADMDDRWRSNAGRWMIRHAARLAGKVTFAETMSIGSLADASDHVADSVLGDLEHWASVRAADPVAWVTGTVLYRAMVAGLAVDGRVPDELMAREGTR